MFNRAKRFFNSTRFSKNNINQNKISEEVLLDAIMLRTNEVILTVSKEGKITSFNEGTIETLGYQRDELLDSLVSTYLARKTRVEVENDMSLIISGKDMDLKLKMLKSNGEIIHTLASISPLPDVKGRPSGSLIVAKDITEKMKYESDLAKANEQLKLKTKHLKHVSRAKDQFLAKVSHDLRSPLNVILGYLEVLQNQTNLQPNTKRILKILLRNANLQLHLVEDLFDMSSIILGKFRISPSTHDINFIIDSALESIKFSAESKEIEVIKNINIDHPLMVCDQDRIQQVLHNLLRNAIKFTPENGKVELHARRKGKSLTLCVVDNGKGMNTDELINAFSANWQSEEFNGSQPKGLGLGLNISKQIVEAHGGEIKAHSKGVNMGTRVTVKLPVKAVQEGSKLQNFSNNENSKHRLKGNRILVAEDSEDALDILHHILSSAGADVVLAKNGKEALDIVDANNIELIISDIDMPELNGYEFLKKARGIESKKDSIRRPAIALSAFTSKEDIRKAYSSGFDSYLTKPVTAKELVLKIHSLLESA